ncbi:MAG: SpoVA/SpoVAEb family sporulation membrane protein [Clostridia bacterium]|nr:SpoVA/SpoVAEb family sporulation membrane protein [Clostridia bacterium]
MKLDEEKQKEYKKILADNMPKTKHFSTILRAFLTGGIICCIGQGINMLIGVILPTSSEDDRGGYTTICMILLTGILTAFGVYDKIGNFGGAGSIVPITGFANSIVSQAMEHKREGVVFGICANMFAIAGPVIVFGITASVIVGIIYLFV